MIYLFINNNQSCEKQTPERHKTSGSERPLLPFDGDWLMTKGVSSQLDKEKRRTILFTGYYL
ncbi:hypothetical protein JOC77_001817 [Peribacillus deserti]|uniref:Toxin SymE-like domain-containing protein n=2 Tax=Peribacillus deserti TaxID=673318 RepID=A0ABS2QGU8_9BACI|nr:hypothetical protein [Peribacillus deserti]